MKVKVISQFRDKHTKRICVIGEELDITKERYNELKGFVEKIKKGLKGA